MSTTELYSLSLHDALPILVAMTLLTASPRDLSAQDSQFGIRGLGTPGRWESVRSRSSGGAFAPFDALSPLMEAPLADISQLTATAAGGTSHRDAQLGDTITKLRATRFPLMGVAGRVAPRDRKSTRLNSSHTVISYAVFCLKKK